jgi:hypothetical protein
VWAGESLIVKKAMHLLSVVAHLWCIRLHKGSWSTSGQLWNITNKAFGYLYFLRTVGEAAAHLQNLGIAQELSLSILP